MCIIILRTLFVFILIVKHIIWGFFFIIFDFLLKILYKRKNESIDHAEKIDLVLVIEQVNTLSTQQEISSLILNLDPII